MKKIKIKYFVDQRVGVVAVRVKTQATRIVPIEAKNKDVVAVWHGHYDKINKAWKVHYWQVEKANALCNLLNRLN